jgi:hypothetical protein
MTDENKSALDRQKVQNNQTVGPGIQHAIICSTTILLKKGKNNEMTVNSKKFLSINFQSSAFLRKTDVPSQAISTHTQLGTSGDKTATVSLKDLH